MFKPSQRLNFDPQVRSVLAMVLAGGRGSRLADLTKWRVKPAVPFGGKYRIIDFALSNCINSGFRRIGVLTQYKSQSLLRHIYRGWNFLNPEFGEFVEVIPAQKRNKDEWYQGTADAIYQNIDLIVKHSPEYTVILGGDHIYKMDYTDLLNFHISNNADITVANIETPKKESSAFGVMCVDENYQIFRFEEKPPNPTTLPGKPDFCLTSMGIYIFNTDLLINLLTEDSTDPDSTHDFGNDIIPKALKSNRVFAWPFRNSDNDKPGYWRDVGTVDSYWEANMDLVSVTPELNLYEGEWPIRSSLVQHPPAKFVFNDEGRRGMSVDSLVSEGSIISGSHVQNSLISSNVYIMDSKVKKSVVLPDVIIHPRSHISNAIIDKYCVIPEGTIIGNDLEEDRQWFHVTPEGIVLVTPEMLNNKELEKRQASGQTLARRLMLDFENPEKNQ